MRIWLLCSLLLLTSCSALHTSVAKRQLDVQTRMSETVYLDPVEPEQRSIFLDIRNTTAEYQLPLADDLRNFLFDRGYNLVDSPLQAQYWLQVNVRTVLKEKPAKVLAQEYGMTEAETHALLHPDRAPIVKNDYRSNYPAQGAVFVNAGVATHVDGQDIVKGLVVLAAFAGAEYVGNQLVKDKYYTMLTDIQIAERIRPDSIALVEETSQHQLNQGDSGSFEQLWQRDTDMRKYQIKVVSFANKANLQWQEAELPLHQGLLRSLAGIF
ncbi:complement resistance protein TraT [Rheinheimera salexigens]|uniref:Conjugal transfer protein TraT n=1 Tax=Rheinheimera salexigens TaxID=1628148 RepID=A0A1E7Q9T0_9GAMM|nr:complement resistance protein TraT [Rheinheimera salexigens]OEY70768.1 conjugal transfer protein TraT [Rheinheimera salexigens]